MFIYIVSGVYINRLEFCRCIIIVVEPIDPLGAIGSKLPGKRGKMEIVPGHI